MLEIKSENIEECFVLYITHEGKTVHTAEARHCMENPSEIEKTLTIMIRSCLYKLFPEINKK